MRDVLSLGSHVYGIYVNCVALPLPGETVLGHDFDGMVLDDGGKGSNQALAAARLGARSSFAGVVGRDAAGEKGLLILAGAGVDVSAVQRCADAPTGVSIAVIDRAGQSMIVTDLGANGRLSAEMVGSLTPLIAAHTVTLLQFESPVPAALAAARAATALGRRAILTPGPMVPISHRDLIGIDIIAPNETETAALLGTTELGDDDAGCIRRLKDIYGVRNVLMTRGKAGATLLWTDEIHRVPAFAVEAKNTIGAGDGFVAAFAAALAWSVPVEHGLAFAAAASALTVSSPLAPWASYPVLADVLGFLQSRGAQETAEAVSRHAPETGSK